VTKLRALMIFAVVTVACFAADKDAECLKVTSLTISPDARWHAKIQNACSRNVGAVVFRLAFYDKDHYRHGFAEFQVEPTQAGELTRMDGDVPRVGDVYVRVYAVNEVAR
jgi:hypothetical protein